MVERSFRSLAFLLVGCLIASGFCLLAIQDLHAQPLRSPFKDVQPREKTIVVEPRQDSAFPPTQPGRVWAVIVGVNEYANRNVPKLQFAVNDARAIRDRVVPRVPASLIKMLYLEDAQATKQRILDAIEDLSTAHPEDTVLIYFSLHGLVDKAGKRGFLVSHDTDPWTLEATGVPVDFLLQKAGSVPAKRLFLMLDACYSGSAVGGWGASAKTFAFGPTTKLGTGLSPEIYDAVKYRRGHFVVSASRPDETSLELESLGHGLFTYFLLEALDGSAARRGNSFVTISDLYDYVSNRVGLFAQSLQQKQTPMMRGEFDGPPPLMTVVPSSSQSRSSDLEKLIREARLSFESSRIVVSGNGLDRIDLFVAGNFHESWKASSKEVRIPKEIFDRHGNEIVITVRATREGRKPEEMTFRLAHGEERRITIEAGALPAPPSEKPWRPVFPPPPA